MKNFIIIIDGPMGAGKSTVASLLLKKLKRTVVLNIDKIKWFISDFKRSKKDNAITRDVMMAMCEQYLKNKINLIVPQGVWKGKRSLESFEDLAKKTKTTLYLFHLDAPHKVLYERVQARPKPEPPKTPVARTRYLRNIRHWKKHRYTHGVEFQTNKISAEKIVRAILGNLKEKKFIIR
jgi:predicted kinase